MFAQDNTRLIYRYDAETLWIEPWGPSALRIRATKSSSMPFQDWALDTPPPPQASSITLSSDQEEASLASGPIQAIVSTGGKLSIYNITTSPPTLVLEEYIRNRRINVTSPKCSALEVESREFKPILGSPNYHLTARFESLDPEEKLFGMGQYQQPLHDLKGCDLELAHRNSQASVPFLLSSHGYGLLWNNPSVGRAVLGKNIMSFEAQSTDKLDYWICLGDTPKEIVERYADVTGKVPMMPEYGLGFWQCKLRYQTQEELLEVAREYRRRELPIDLIVVDFFHWPTQGTWRMDETYWPDINAMISELRSLQLECMVSVWPTVDKESENYAEMLEKGLLVRVDRGMRTVMDFQGDTVHFDATNPSARQYVWDKCKTNYYDKGIKVFWLDEAEPEYSAYDFDNYRYFEGPNLSVGNVYPREYARAFYEGMKKEGQENIVNLLRCAWAGSQKYGALVWSGDIASSWWSLRNQVAAGLHMAISGFPWWTTDIGGFHGGDPKDEKFRELFVRWFQWGAFCPVFRLHGDREPRQPQRGTTGGAECRSGAPNEVWCYGEAVYKICKKYMFIREEMREYTRGLMKEAHEKGSPVMRPLFYEFPEDEKAWAIGEEYMYGPKYLVCPVLAPGTEKMSTYLPTLPGGGKWTLFQGEKHFEGGQTVTVECPMDTMPVFLRS